MSHLSSPTTVERSFADFLCSQWTTLCRSSHFNDEEIFSSRAELLDLLGPWANAPIGRGCRYRSYVASDGFPAEFSLSWRGGGPEVRILFESLASDFSAQGAQDAGRILTRRLATKLGVDITRYLTVEHLFITSSPLPDQPTIWHSLAKRSGSPPRYKVYLNPQANGAHRALETVSEAMARIGMHAAWRPVAERYEELASSGHKIEFFALDLERADIARAKVYFRHGPVTVEELDTIASLARTHDSKRALRAYRACYKHELIVNEPITCLAFRLGSDCPDEANVYLRLNVNDGSDPTMEILRAEGVDPSSYLALREINQPHTSMKYELLSFRTLAPQHPAEIGLYLRFPQYKTVKTSAAWKDVVVLCSPEGTAVGTLPKSKVHHYATPLHLAFSSYLFDQDGNLLVTRRALTKSTWPGVITNSCCGHPSPNEPFAAAIERRIKHELGLSATNIKLVLPAFAYRAEMANGIVENELCPVFTAVVNPAELAFNPGEVDSTEWVPWSSFAADVLSGAREVSPWCKLQVAQLVSLGSNPLAWSAASGAPPSTALPSHSRKAALGGFPTRIYCP